MFRGHSIGIVTKKYDTTYGMVYIIHWTWASKKAQCTVEVPESLLTSGFWDRFKLVRGNYDK